MAIRKILGALILSATAFSLAYAAGDLTTRFSNRGSISNTRHNLTQHQDSGGPSGGIMDAYRNNYQEVCVYCHTPHGSNANVNLPLWNRTLKSTTYNTYNELGTSSLRGEVSQPGNNSLACLSCHDGQTAIDSIINMPGSGRYMKAQETTQNDGFLSTWTDSNGYGTPSHLRLTQGECLACHSPGAGMVGASAADFTVAAIGTDLKNDHPIGVVFPKTAGPGTDFKAPAGTKGTTSFFDVNGNGGMDSGDIRLYISDGKAKVECASCHDPHGVPTAGRDSQFFPTFLRMSNAGSSLCLTCHTI